MSNADHLRKRKLKEQHNGKSVSPRNKKRQAQPDINLHRSLLCLIMSGTILTLFVVLYVDQIPWYIGHRAIDHIAKKFGYNKPAYVVVIDAGSTGSRVLAFSFHEAYMGGHLVLDKELFRYTKPGLSSFANEPDKGVATIENLLEQAKDEIPQEYWSQTPLILRATAGLRLLPAAKAENLLNSVKALFKRMPFLTNENSVEIMDGTDEGIMSWFTVNFLSEKFSGNPANTVAALDLGGGSTQVTFAATTPASLKEIDKIHNALTPKGEISVYTHSYLGLGLMAARKEILTVGQEGNTSVISECVNPIIKNRKWTYGGTDYLVSGLQSGYPTSKVLGGQFLTAEEVPIVNFDKCSGIIRKYVESRAQPPEELPLKTIFAFSYYFDRATEVGLIDESTGGRIQVGDFKKAAEESCHTANADQPFMCLDLTFIWVLLEKGFGLKSESSIYLYKKINGHEISWALGAGYNLLRGHTMGH